MRSLAEVAAARDFGGETGHERPVAHLCRRGGRHARARAGRLMDRLSQSAPAKVSLAGGQMCGDTQRNPELTGGPHFDVTFRTARSAAASRPALAMRLRWLGEVAV